MREKLGSFLSNESSFGKFMSVLLILIVTNLLFIVSCIPVITMGPGLAAMFYTLLKLLRGNTDMNPVSVFWKGFRENWKQGLLGWLFFGILWVVLYLEIFWAHQFSAPVSYVVYGLYAVLLLSIMIAVFYFPGVASFRAGFVQQLKNSLLFFARAPWVGIVGAVLYGGLLLATKLDEARQPAYVFFWFIIGFSLIGFIIAKLILPVFVPYLPKVNEWGDILTEKDFEEDESF